jgi:DNA-binding response OmpR family regulator
VPRPTILVAEPEPDQALSIRKLVLETAKYNVLTAHSTQEALDLFGLFPNVNAVLLVRGDKLDCERIAKQVRAVAKEIPLLGIRCDGIDYSVESYDPGHLLHILRNLLGDPRETEP